MFIFWHQNRMCMNSFFSSHVTQKEAHGEHSPAPALFFSGAQYIPDPLHLQAGEPDLTPLQLTGLPLCSLTRCPVGGRLSFCSFAVCVQWLALCMSLLVFASVTSEYVSRRRVPGEKVTTCVAILAVTEFLFIKAVCLLIATSCV